jgi:hypothetical protein
VTTDASATRAIEHRRQFGRGPIQELLRHAWGGRRYRSSILSDILALLHRSARLQALLSAPPDGVAERQVSFPGNFGARAHEVSSGEQENRRCLKHLVEGSAAPRTPVSGKVIALDPDIPAAHQRIACAEVEQP